MNKKRLFIYIYIYLLLELWLIFTPKIFAQKKGSPLTPKDTEGYVSMGIMAQGFHYFGDVYSSGLQFTRPGIGAYIARKISPKMQVRLAVSVGSIAGNDAATSEGSPLYARNLHFRNRLQELSSVFTWDILASHGKHKKRRGFSPYLLAGIALLHHNPQAKLPENMGGGGLICNHLAQRDKADPIIKPLTIVCRWFFRMGLGFVSKLMNAGILP